MPATAIPDWASGLADIVEDRYALARLAAEWFGPTEEPSRDAPGSPGPSGPPELSGPPGPSGSPGPLATTADHEPTAAAVRSVGDRALDALAGVPRSVAEELSAIWLLLRTISLTDFGSLDPPLASREFAALHLLQTTGPLRVIDVGELLRMDKSTTSRVVRAMLDRGLLDRARHPTDGRAFLVELTEVGRRAVEDAVSARELTLVAVLAQWDDQARTDLLAALLRLRREWSSLMPERWQGTSNAPSDELTADRPDTVHTS